MATVAERVSVLETKVDNFDEKFDDIKHDITTNHTDLKTQLKTMYDASCTQHAELAGKIKELEGFKSKWTYIIAGAIAALGWASGHVETLSAFFK